ncbi:MAG: extracellular solute-binding protein [Lachnospiraceae bacterium]|nr:extracellular solute-binding protein [Lachnospiraceae bacterium]
MKKLLAMLLAAVMVLSLAACGGAGGAGGSGGGDAAKVDTTAEGFKIADYTWETQPGSNKYEGRKLRVLLTVGGGGNYYEPAIKRMMEFYPGLEVELEFTAGAADVLRTSILEGNAYDIYNCNAGDLPYFDAINQGIAYPIDGIFEVPTMDGTKKLGDLMDMSLFGIGEKDGKHYVMADMLYMEGLWYDDAWFQANGITVPTDWASFQEMAQQCDALGADALGACGLMAHEYPTNYWFWPMVASTSWDLYSKLQNLDYEQWNSDEMKRVVEKMLWIRDNGYFDTDTNGLGNAETQMEFIDHKFAILPCGSWLEAEMADAWTEGWSLKFLPYSFGDDAGKTYLKTDCLASLVSPTTKNMDLVCEFYRFLFSDPDSLKGGAQVHTNVFKIPGYGDLCGEYLAPSVKDVATKSESMKTINIPCQNWYTTIAPEIGNMIVGLMGGDIDGDTFRQRGYDLFKGIADDSNIEKYEFKG